MLPFLRSDSGFNLLQGTSQAYTVMLPFTSTLRQYSGIWLRVQITSGSPMYVKDLHLNWKETQITLHLSRAGLDLATLGFRDKHLNLLSRGGVLFLIKPGMLQPLQAHRYTSIYTV